MLKGARGVPDLRMVKINFYVVLNLENTGNNSTGNNNTGNNSMRADFNRDFTKLTIFGIFKTIFSYIFYPIILKLNSVVLGVN